MDILFTILILLLATRTFGAIATSVGQPALIGEVIAGVVLGIIVTRYPDHFTILANHSQSETFMALTDLGIFFLMLLGGVELLPKSLIESPKKSILIGLGGIIVPFLSGIGLGWTFLPSSTYKFAQSLFLGTALAITALPVTIKVLLDLKKLNTKVGKLLVSAAFFDDVLGIVLLAVLLNVVENGSMPGVTSFLTLLGKIFLFFVVCFLVGHYLFNRFAPWVSKFDLDELEFSIVLVFALIYSAFAEYLHLHFILGAFIAGLFFRRSSIDEDTYYAVKSKISAVTSGFLAPLFFASIGLQVSTEAITQVPLFVFALILVAVLGKLLGAGLTGWGLGLKKSEAAAIGFGMCGRGAVELIVADIALKEGLLDHPQPPTPVIKYMFSAVVLMAVFTTLITPFFMKKAFSN